MPRKLRLEYAGAVYHVLNRGDRREDICQDDQDRGLFLKTLGEACAKTGWQVHAYCLMSNHFHLVTETPRANLSAGMQWFLGTYTARFNRRHRSGGHLFSGRFKALVVDGSGTGYLKSVCDYVHLNPVRAGLLGPGQRLAEYPWSSYVQYLKRPEDRPVWLRVDRLLGEWGISRDGVTGRRQFAAAMEERKRQELSRGSEQWTGVRQGWCLGGPAFREGLLAMAEEKCGEQHYGEAVRESEEHKAERLAQEMLTAAKVRDWELARRRKGDPVKTLVAGRLRRETTMTWKWIAHRLAMGHWRSAANGVRRAKVEQVKVGE